MEIAATIAIVGGVGGAWGSWAKVINPYLKRQKKKVQERDNKLNEIHQELKFNGGTSLKDVVFKISKKTDEIENRLDGIEENIKQSMNLQGIAFWISDENGLFTYASPGLCKVIGRSESELNGNNWMGWLHPNDKQRIVDAWEFAINNKAPFDEIYSFKKSDGRWQKVWAQAFPKTTKNNSLGGILGKLVPIEEK